MSRETVQALRALGNPARLRVFLALRHGAMGTCCDRILYYEGGACVGDAVNMLGLSQSTVSHHLKVLQASGLVRVEKRGQWSCLFPNHQAIERLKRELAELL
ncbi:MAG: helix-turn-helix domain-containing protein [Acetobacteraceae bacterium]|nr:helix-turn-helix domain-containing protein [Acetobacteraceae bacterium]